MPLPSDPGADRLAEAAAHAEYDKDRVVLTRDGKPVAAVVPIEDLEALEAADDAADEAAYAEGLAEYQQSGAGWPTRTVDELAAQWDADSQRVYHPPLPVKNIARRGFDPASDPTA